MQLKFTKMEGLGNDFVVIDTRTQRFEPEPEMIRRLAHRRTGIGFDQALIVEPPRSPDTEAYYRIFNADGGEVEQCGNGARCIARYMDPLGRGRILSLESPGGVVRARCLAGGDVMVDMGPPRFEPRDLPLEADVQADRYALQVDGNTLEVGAVSMGNPHAVLQVDSVETAAVDTLGPKISRHPNFPRQTNAEFLQVVDRQTLRLRVYERGTGETLACGTGACAAAVMAQRWGLTEQDVTVQLPGGELQVSWEGPGNPVWMTGPAKFVFEGIIEQ